MQTLPFVLKEEFIPLIQLLKYTGIADSGARASELVSDGLVLCNGAPETRKRYKVRKGDVIQIDDVQIVVS